MVSGAGPILEQSARDCWTSFEGARKTVPLEEFDERVPTLLRVFGAPVDVDAPPTPFALGPEIDGADFDLRGQGSPGQHL